MKTRFALFAGRVSHWAGSPWAFLLATSVVLAWLIAGIFMDFTNTFYQLLINTGTTIVTFLMVFLIQNTQNRDALAVHLKLDELIRSIQTADNTIIRAEDETDEELADLKRKYEALLDEHAELRAQLDVSPASGKKGRPA